LRHRHLWQKWTEFRTNKIDSFVAGVPEAAAKASNLILSVAVFPLSEHDRQKLQQHWEVWASRGDVNLVVPMTYALDTYRFQRLSQPGSPQPNWGLPDFAGNSPARLHQWHLIKYS